MQKIHRLSPDQAQKIAAGEVVERPANIVKELVENALDAGATKISISITDGGKQSIRVVDNGCGMSPEDARLCFEQHATSKITHVNDLPTINTFGFRGEALASIAAVSRTTLITKEADAAHGFQVGISDGIIHEATACSANTGTDITIADIFFNLPARKKFLKTRETEWHQIEQLFRAMAFAHLHVDFKLYHDGKQLYNCCATTSIQERYTQLYAHTDIDRMLAVNTHHAGVSIRGIISDSQLQRYDRSAIYLFVNNRWVKDLKLMRSIMRGYNHVLQPSRYPAAVIALEIDPTLLDINIHPRKEEVQFMHPRIVETAVQKSITQTLQERTTDTLITASTQKPEIFGASALMQTDNAQRYTPPTTPMHAPYRDIFAPDMMRQARVHNPPTSNIHTDYSKPMLAPHDTQDAHHQTESVLPTSFIALQQEASFGTVLAQLHQTYILVEQEHALLLIDQHAAHERILYQQIKEQPDQLEPIALLFPLLMQCQEHELAALEPYLEQLHHHGIICAPFGATCLKITALPVLFKERSVESCIRTLIAWLIEQGAEDTHNIRDHLRDALHQRMACTAAVKSGDQLDMQQMQHIVRTLAITAENFSCPHGRPTTWQIERDTITKRFKRDYRQQKKNNGY